MRRRPAVAKRGRVAVGGGLNVRWRDGDVGPNAKSPPGALPAGFRNSRPWKPV